MYKGIIITFGLLVYCLLLQAAKPPTYKDSLYQVLQQSREDTGTVKALLLYGEILYRENPDSAAQMYLRALKLARQLKYHRGAGLFTIYFIDILNGRGQYTEAIALLEQGAIIFKLLQDATSLVCIYNNIANEYQYQGNYTVAANTYLTGLNLAEKHGVEKYVAKMNNNLAAVFISLADFPKVIKYASKAYLLAAQRQDTAGMASSMVNLSGAAAKMGKYQDALNYNEQVITLGRQLHDSSYVLDGMINIGSINSELQEHDKAAAAFTHALAITKVFHSPEYLQYIYMSYAEELYKTKQYRTANEYISQAIRVSESLQATDELRQAYLSAALIKEALAQPAMALQYRKKYEALNDSLLGENTRKHVQQLEIQYQTEKKDKELTEKKLLLTQKDLQLQQKNNWIIAFLLGTTLLIITVFIIWLKFQHKQRMHEQKLQVLEKEKTVQLLEAIMHGEEKERTRLSKDLHDGVGGLLSAVKMHFSALKREQSSLQDNTAYAHALGLLDDAIGDVRKTAHNLMPEMLSRLGLKEALHLYCRNISHSRELQITFHTYGTVHRYKSNFELSVYRIIQELVNNIVKHSQATEALVQLSQHQQLLSITVEDNGIGFNQQVAQQNGMGLKSLQSRIKALNGNIEIDAASGQGTTAYIEFDVSVLRQDFHMTEN
jgi:signal transduction histidine kinase